MYESPTMSKLYSSHKDGLYHLSVDTKFINRFNAVLNKTYHFKLVASSEVFRHEIIFSLLVKLIFYAPKYPSRIAFLVVIVRQLCK